MKNTKNRILILCTTDSMIYNFLIPHIADLVKNGYKVVCACSRTGDYFDILKNDYKISILQVDFERSPYNLSNIKAYRQLDKIIKKEKINIIFCHEPVGGAMGRLTGLLNNCKVIYMAHGFHFYKGAPKKMAIYYLVEKALSRCTDTLITINDEDYTASKRLHAKKNVKLNGIGIDTSKFNYAPNSKYLRNILGLDSESVILLSVGELITRKNHSTMIQAMQYLPSTYHYVIVGDGELLQNLKMEISRYKLSDRVHLMGYRRDVSLICNSSDIYVMPSFQEGLSVAVMEAMACGLPIVASKIRGNVDLIDHGKGGYLVKVDNPKQYAKAILTIEKKENRQKFGQYNREKVKLFDINTVRKQLSLVFKEVQ